MARPKERLHPKHGPTQSGMSQAFANKSQQELEKLHVKVASNLGDNLVSLFDQGIHTDLIVTNGSCEIEAHHCILRARAKDMWPENLLYSTVNSEDRKMKAIHMNGLTETEIRNFLRQVYCVTDAELLFKEFLPYFEQQSSLGGETKNLIVQEVHDSSVDINSNSDPKGKDNETTAGVIIEENCDTLQDNSDEESIENQNHQGGCTDSHDEMQNKIHNDNQLTNIKAHCENDLGDQKSIGDERCTNCIADEHGEKKEMVCGPLADVGNEVDIDSSASRIIAPESSNIMPNSSFEGDDKAVVHTSETGSKIPLKSEAGSHIISLEESKAASTSTRGHGNPAIPNNSNTASCTEDIRDENKIENDQSLNRLTLITNGDIEENGSKCVEVDNTVPIPSESQKTFDNAKNDLCFVSPYNTCSPVGSDLLRMYLQNQHCDCCLSVEGVHFLSHRCILSARSPFFSAMFGGQWSESSLEVVNLEGVSAQAMEKVLLFFYGGVIEVISSSDIFHLFIIADMYGVETMKFVLQFFVRKDMCHFFHKPCTSCINRAPEALSLCHTFHLEELQDRLLKWISKYFTKIWVTKIFASVPEEVHQLCVKAIVKQMTEENVLDIIIDCDKMATSLPRIKWTESILVLITQLMDLAIEFTSTNFIKVIHAPEFLTWAKIATWKASALEEIFNTVIDSLPIDTAISVYQTLIDLKYRETVSETVEQNVLDLLDTMIKRCEKFLRTHIHQVTRSEQWSSINKTFQSQILESSHYFHLDHFPDAKPRAKKPVVSSSLSRLKPNSAMSLPSSARTQKHTMASSTMEQKPKKDNAARIISKNNNAATAEKMNINSASKTTNPSLLNKQLATSKLSARLTSKGAVKANTVVKDTKNKTSKTGGHTKENYSQIKESPPLSMKNSEKMPNSSAIPMKLSSSSPSDRPYSPGLGRSPPSSRIPLKSSTKCKSDHNLSFLHHNQSSPVSREGRESGNLTQASSETLSCVIDDNQSNSSIATVLSKPEITEECLQEPSVVYMTKNSMDASSFPPLTDSVRREGCESQEHLDSESMPAEGQLVNEINSLEVTEDGLSFSIIQNIQNHDGSNGQEGLNENGQIPPGHAVSQVSESHDKENTICVLQETNVLKSVPPVKVSFVIPADENEETY